MDNVKTQTTVELTRPVQEGTVTITMPESQAEGLVRLLGAMSHSDRVKFISNSARKAAREYKISRASNNLSTLWRQLESALGDENEL
jgi:hypothetical protein